MIIKQNPKNVKEQQAKYLGNIISKRRMSKCRVSRQERVLLAAVKKSREVRYQEWTTTEIHIISSTTGQTLSKLTPLLLMTFVERTLILLLTVEISYIKNAGIGYILSTVSQLASSSTVMGTQQG